MAGTLPPCLLFSFHRLSIVPELQTLSPVTPGFQHLQQCHQYPWLLTTHLQTSKYKVFFFPLKSLLALNIKESNSAKLIPGGRLQLLKAVEFLSTWEAPTRNYLLFLEMGQICSTSSLSRGGNKWVEAEPALTHPKMNSVIRFNHMKLPFFWVKNGQALKISYSSVWQFPCSKWNGKVDYPEQYTPSYGIMRLGNPSPSWIVLRSLGTSYWAFFVVVVAVVGDAGVPCDIE